MTQQEQEALYEELKKLSDDQWTELMVRIPADNVSHISAGSATPSERAKDLLRQCEQNLALLKIVQSNLRFIKYRIRYILGSLALLAAVFVTIKHEVLLHADTFINLYLTAPIPEAVELDVFAFEMTSEQEFREALPDILGAVRSHTPTPPAIYIDNFFNDADDSGVLPSVFTQTATDETALILNVGNTTTQGLDAVKPGITASGREQLAHAELVNGPLGVIYGLQLRMQDKGTEYWPGAAWMLEATRPPDQEAGSMYYSGPLEFTAGGQTRPFWHCAGEEACVYVCRVDDLEEETFELPLRERDLATLRDRLTGKPVFLAAFRPDTQNSDAAPTPWKHNVPGWQIRAAVIEGALQDGLPRDAPTHYRSLLKLLVAGLTGLTWSLQRYRLAPVPGLFGVLFALSMARNGIFFDTISIVAVSCLSVLIVKVFKKPQSPE